MEMANSRVVESGDAYGRFLNILAILVFLAGFLLVIGAILAARPGQAGGPEVTSGALLSGLSVLGAAGIACGAVVIAAMLAWAGFVLRLLAASCGQPSRQVKASEGPPQGEAEGGTRYLPGFR